MKNKVKYAAIVLLSCNLFFQFYNLFQIGEIERNRFVKEEKEYHVNLVATGDILIHDRVYNDLNTDVDTYNFDPVFSNVKKYIEEADIAMTNVETMIGGVELGLSGYPRFNSPYEVGDTLKNVGYDVVTLANNHAYDLGEVAIENALNYWDKLDMVYTGVSRNKEEQSIIKILKKNNITFSFLAYTYGTNGLSLPVNSPYSVNMIDREKIKMDIEEAKKVSDVIIVSPHFGTEYESLPNEEQKELVQFLADEGVHIVVGSHPHVLQPPTFLKGKNGNHTYVMYSLGNFLSGQYGLERRIGGVFGITIQKNINKDGEVMISLKEPTVIPTYTAYENDQNYELYPIKQIPFERLNEKDMIYEKIKDELQINIPLKFK